MNLSSTLAGALWGMDRQHSQSGPAQHPPSHLGCKYSVQPQLSDEEPAQRGHMAVLSHMVVSGKGKGKAMSLGRAHQALGN